MNHQCQYLVHYSQDGEIQCGVKRARHQMVTARGRTVNLCHRHWEKVRQRQLTFAYDRPSEEWFVKRG